MCASLCTKTAGEDQYLEHEFYAKTEALESTEQLLTAIAAFGPSYGQSLLAPCFIHRVVHVLYSREGTSILH